MSVPPTTTAKPNPEGGRPGYSGPRYALTDREGTQQWVPLLDLAKAWKIDYAKLRDLVRDQTNLPTKKTLIPGKKERETVTIIVVREADLTALHNLLESHARKENEQPPG